MMWDLLGIEEASQVAVRHAEQRGCDARCDLLVGVEEEYLASRHELRREVLAPVSDRKDCARCTRLLDLNLDEGVVVEPGECIQRGALNIERRGRHARGDGLRADCPRRASHALRNGQASGPMRCSGVPTRRRNAASVG